jgi:ubiquitin carboxyl-terminal hydrolase 4/11/15
LNRVLDKPLVEKDDNRKEDPVKSLEQWYGFLLRNQSLLVDLLYGQFKSTLYCPDEKCQNISTTFDPFLSISLPLTPKVDLYEITCFFIFYDISIQPLQLLLPFSTECTIMALRNKIGKIMKVHPYSFFIVKMDSDGNYDYLLSTTHLLKTNNYYQSANQRPFFLFQINPEFFYSKFNKHFINDKSTYSLINFGQIFEQLSKRDEENKKLFSEDYEEDESNSCTESNDNYYSKSQIKKNEQIENTIIKYNTDGNYGFESDYIKIILYLEKYDENYDVRLRQRIIFPRILYVNESWTCDQIHLLLFDYFSFLLLNKKEDSPKAWNRYFGNINTENKNDTYDFQKANNYPYRIRIKNIMEKQDKPCCICEKLKCHDCLLPYSDEIKLKSLIEKFPKNFDQKPDNSYFFLSENQRRYQYKWNRDFSLVMTWMSDYKKKVYTLNDKKDYNFKIQKAEVQKSVSIYDCFKNFIKLEKLEDMNEWYCSNCKDHKKATKKMEIYKSPHIMIIHLKRFKNLSKIETLVDFPIIGLDISSSIISNDDNFPLIYDLFAIANHYGGTGFGHYIAYAKNPFSHQWYKFDDSQVTPISQTQIVTSGAYVLFYRRRGLENIIDLGEIYSKGFINYEGQIPTVEHNLNAINQVLTEKFHK